MSVDMAFRHCDWLLPPRKLKPIQKQLVGREGGGGGAITRIYLKNCLLNRRILSSL